MFSKFPTPSINEWEELIEGQIPSRFSSTTLTEEGIEIPWIRHQEQTESALIQSTENCAHTLLRYFGPPQDLPNFASKISDPNCHWLLRAEDIPYLSSIQSPYVIKGTACELLSQPKRLSPIYLADPWHPSTSPQDREKWLNLAVPPYFDGYRYHLDGMSSSWELACLIAELLEAHSQKPIIKKPRITLASTPKVLETCSKIRAFNLLLLKLYSLKQDSVFLNCHLHLRPSALHFSCLDTPANLNRSILCHIGSYLGGCDSLESLPHTFDPKELEEAQRVAYFQLLVLSLETQLYEVIDPVAGSYSIEDLTKKIVEKTWSNLQEIARQGGLKSWYDKQERPSPHFQKNLHSLCQQKDKMIGTSWYPQSQTVTPSPPPPETPYRYSKVFEKLRRLSLPKLLILGYKDPKIANLRSQFIDNYLHLCQIPQSSSQIACDLQELESILQNLPSEQPLIALCAHDKDYPELLEQLEKYPFRYPLAIAGHPKLKLNSKHSLHYFYAGQTITQALEDLVEATL